MTDSLEQDRVETPAEDLAQTESPETTAANAADVPATLPDITTGDMETDLLPSDDVVVPAEEIEIPWGEVALPSAEVPPEAEASAEETPAPETPVDTPYKRAWYVVHCYSGYENKVKKGLEQRITSMGLQDRLFRVVVPVEKEVEIKEGQRRNIERRVFPGYILVEMMELHPGEPVSDEAWYVVRNTPGVTGFVSADDKPVPLRADEVTKILTRMETEEPKVHVTFRVGQNVRIIDGPFADFRGAVDNVDMTKGKVRVLVSFFGRETPVELDLLQVEKV